MFSSEEELGEHLHDGIGWGGTGSRGSLWPLLAVVMPAWWRCHELCWAVDLLVVDIRVVPSEALEVLTAVSESHIVELAAVTVLRRVLTVDHPPGAGLRAMESLLALNLVAGVRLTSVGVIEAWSGDVEVSLAIADRVGWWAVVGSLENDGL